MTQGGAPRIRRILDFLDEHVNHLRGRWRVYDIHIEGVSLVNNYRSQFNAVIRD